MRLTLLPLILLTLLSPASGFAADTTPVDFTRDVQPILTAHCVKCHGPDKQESGLRLDAGEAIRRGGDSGPALIAGKAAESLLVQAVSGTSDVVSQMPLKADPLTEQQVAVLRSWIDAGAKFPAESTTT